MDKRRLMGTDLDVSVICYGPMRAPQAHDDPAVRQHQRAMEVAIERGVNLIHSSYEYGVRWLMTPVLRNHPERHDLLHVIKAPVPDWDDDGFDPAKLEARIDDALRELCTDRIALVQWMWRCRPHEEAPRLTLLAKIRDAVGECFERLRDKGKVAHMGCFPYFPQSAGAALDIPGNRALIAYYNPIEMEMRPLIQDAAARGQGFLAIRPLYEGVLTSRYADHAALPREHRLAKPKYATAFAHRARLAAVLPEAAADMTRFAIRFPLLTASCASVIVGLNSEAQVHELCDHAQGVRPDDVTVARVKRVFDEMSQQEG
ncbi:aldo/keto reductase [Roseinatronobacter alkalisoli]|uniref:Aldo/keto reductase n=1 Tax=Roseinatronobacter alkalisoli TaxID=3028235 RepID=A0ABT5TCA4_9RHOB|nr:aldo/keto reductase [Roseinatronobacter sp. HJB301]MDD7972757.1 aldo/keto reductase [Roseinatronobacter sp. HJB301]